MDFHSQLKLILFKRTLCLSLINLIATTIKLLISILFRKQSIISIMLKKRGWCDKYQIII